MRIYAKAWPDRVWAVEGANGVGRPLAQRLLEAGEQVVDVPAKKAPRARLFDTGHNRPRRARRGNGRGPHAHPAGAVLRRAAWRCRGCSSRRLLLQDDAMSLDRSSRLISSIAQRRG
jgi:hypothetical protein